MTQRQSNPQTQREITQYSTPSGHQLSKAELLDEIRRVASELGEVPSYSEMNEHGEYSMTPYESRFATWTSAVKKAGFEPVGQKTYSRDELISEVQSVGESLDSAPTFRDMKRRSDIAGNTFIKRFGSWSNALREAGFDPFHRQTEIGELIDDIIDVACQVGRSPYGRELNEHGEYTDSTCQRWFGSWAEALRMAGLPPRYRGGRSYGDCDSSGTYGANWERARDEALKRDRQRCQHCGLEYHESREQYGEGLHVHHIYPIRAFETPEAANFLDNLITLCKECHQKWEASGPFENEINEAVSKIEEARSS
jgi:hypothetical protein